MTERVPVGLIAEAGISNRKPLGEGDWIRTGIIRQAQTLDATPVPVYTRALKNDEARNIKITGSAIQPVTGDTQFKYMVGGVNQTGGTAAIVGAPTVVDLSEDAGAAAWDITLTVAGDEFSVNVVGEAAHIIDWIVRVELT